MNIKKVIRNIQLSKLGISELDSDEKKIYEFLIDNLSKLNTYISDDNPNCVYFGKNIENIVLSYYEKNELLNVSYEKIWSFFSRDTGMIYENIQLLVIWWGENTLNLKVKNSQFIFDNNYIMTERELRKKTNNLKSI